MKWNEMNWIDWLIDWLVAVKAGVTRVKNLRLSRDDFEIIKVTRGNAPVGPLVPVLWSHWAVADGRGRHLPGATVTNSDE